MDRGTFRNAPPVNVGDELTVTIESVGEKGDGVAKKDGFVIFVPGAQQGQQVEVRITRVLKKMSFAEIIGADKAEEPSQEEAQQSEKTEAQVEKPEQNRETPQDPQSEQAEAENQQVDTEDFGEDLEEKKE